MSYSRREALVITEQKKKECNAKALRIVESMLDDGVKPEWVLNNAKYISQSHYQDVIEERAISKQCGYPLCSASLGKIPNQQFHISMKTNKVYDITERKNFCSNSCYKASQFFKEQLLTSPVWLRDSETIPTFQLLPPNSPGGHLGKEVDFDYGIRTPVEPNEQNVKVELCPTPISSKGCHENCFKDDECGDKSTATKRGVLDNKHGDVVISTNENPPQSVVASKNQSNCRDVHDKPLKKKGKAKKNDCDQTPVCTSLVERIEKCFSEWFTLDSLIFIYGIDRAKDMLKDRVDCLKSENRYPQTHMDPVMERKFNNICKKLNILDMEANLESEGFKERETKPLPNLKQIQEDAKLMEIKVREFYKGSTRVSFRDEQKDDDDTSDSHSIPLVDLHAQNALRRRIILDRLRHILPDLLRTLGMTSRDIGDDVRELFITFSLKADNIMFKPAEWNLISLIILKMLSIKDAKLKTLMETQLAQKYCSMMLMAFQLDYGYLDRLILSLCEADSLINVIQ